MSNTSKLSIKYYNRDTPEDYEYTVEDTIQSFLAKHSNIGDAPISHIFVGMYMYPGNCQLSILNVVNNMVQGEPIVAFPSAVSLPITHISSNGRAKHMLMDFKPLAKLNKLKDELCKIFNIPANTEYKFYSDVETELPYNLYQFNFEATTFHIVEKPQK